MKNICGTKFYGGFWVSRYNGSFRNWKQILIKARLTFSSQGEWWQVGHFIKMRSIIKWSLESLSMSQNPASSMVGGAEL